MSREYCDFCAKRYFTRELFFVGKDEYACNRCLKYMEEEGVFDGDFSKDDSEDLGWFSQDPKKPFYV